MTAIRLYRTKMNLTQKQLADRLQVTASTVTQWENGVRKPNVIMLKKIAAVLKCTTDDLLEPVRIDYK